MRTGRSGPKTPAEVARLFTVAPRDFIRERNALAARLRAAGRRAEAADVQGIARPTIAVWAVNQAARSTPSAVARLLASTEQLRRGASEAGDLRAAIAEEHAAIAAVHEAARRALSAAGYSASTDVARRIATTLRGAAADRAGRDELREGRLRREWEAPGFELLAGTKLPALRLIPGGRSGRRAAPPTGRRAGNRADVRRALQAARAVREREAAEAAGAERERRAQQAAELERIAGDRQREAERADAEVADAARRLAELRARAVETRRSAAHARQSARRARRGAAIKGRRPDRPSG